MIAVGGVLVVNGRDAGRCLLDLIGESSIWAAFKTCSREGRS